MKMWLWRAWSKDRERICDCGTAKAPTSAEARGIAWVCLGGPHADEVVSIEVEEIT